VIPVLDLRKRFGLPASDATRRSRIVVGELGEHTVGLVVDGVSEVLLVGSDAVEPPSTLVTSADSAFLRGVAKLEERLILLLDLSRILTRAEQEDLAA
jgi:purine-binding chemotaxis protein CheW